MRELLPQLPWVARTLSVVRLWRASRAAWGGAQTAVMSCYPQRWADAMNSLATMRREGIAGQLPQSDTPCLDAPRRFHRKLLLCRVRRKLCTGLRKANAWTCARSYSVAFFRFFHREVVVAVLCLDTAGCALAATTRDHRGRLIERSGCASVPDCNGFRIS